MTVLYRHFDKDKNLLYIGISSNLHKRCESHKFYSEWFSFVETIQVQHFKNRKQAEECERQAILYEKPIYNKKIAFPTAMVVQKTDAIILFKNMCEKNLSNREIALMIGLSESTICRWKVKFPKNISSSIYKKIQKFEEKLK